MNPMATSKADILKISRELIQQNGWAAVNIRAVAAACGVSVGCIYNYFGSKTELVSAAVESIWNDIFHHPEDEAVFQDTLSCIRWMYRQMEYGCQQYPGFFTHHALGFVQQDTADGKQQMRQTWQHILDALCNVLRHDAKVRPDAFTEQFTPGTVCGHPVLPDAVRGGAAELRPLCGAGDRAQDHLLSKKTSHKPCGSFLSPNVNIVQFGFCPLQTILLQALFPSMLPVRLCRAGSL